MLLCCVGMVSLDFVLAWGLVTYTVAMVVLVDHIFRGMGKCCKCLELSFL